VLPVTDTREDVVCCLATWCISTNPRRSVGPASLGSTYACCLPAIPTPSRHLTITLRDGARVILRSISPRDKKLLAASFARLSEESRYRRFFTVKDTLSAAELDYFVHVDHSDHEAIIAVDPLSRDLLGVARYIRSTHEADVAEVAVTVADDWQNRGLGRALLDRLTYRARRQGVRKFSALVQSDNPASLGLLENVGDTERQVESGLVELVIDLPPKQGIGAQLAQALRGAAAGDLAPAHTLTHRLAVSTLGRERLE
jgi:RimJ/RimL family protein N-acetyltransferase